MYNEASAVCAIVVTYHPDLALLGKLVDIVSTQSAQVVVVDNSGPNPVVASALPASAVFIPGERNIGLAAAQNRGIAWAREHGYDHILLLDQDSTPAPGMVGRLVEGLARLRAEHQVAAVGPRFHDLRESRFAPFVRIRFPVNQRLWCDGEQAVRCDFLIASGMLIPMEVLDTIGPMDEGLFIDNVDLEWGFRAQAKGYALFGLCGATMHHRLGDARKPLPLRLGSVVVHGPQRLYFIMRNRVLLYRMRHVPRIWVAQDLPRLFAKLFLFGVLIGPRPAHWRCMLRGLWDGVRGRSGPCPADEG